MKLKKGAFELLLEGRSPVATVELSGEDSELHGAAEFYPTPLGVVVCAELSGLPARRSEAVFGLSVGGEVTPIFAKAGTERAWCAAMTRHKTVTEVLGETVSVLASRSERSGGDRAVRIGRGTVHETRLAL